jgi:group I intron endonuclease
MITYRVVNAKNGKWYVGSAVNFERRKKEHLRSKLHDPFHNALRKNPDYFIWEIIEEDARTDRQAEQLILDVWFRTEFCYNLNPSSIGFSSETASIATLSRTDEGKRAGGRASGHKLGKNTHKNYPEKMKENGRNTIEKLIAKDPNHQSKAGKIGGAKGSREKKRVGGLKCKENGIGIFSLTKEERSKLSKKTIKKTNSQLWIDPEHLELGEHRACVLVSMQKRRGLPYGKENRIRIK